MKVVLTQKSSKETILNQQSVEITKFTNQRNTLREEIGALETEKTKLMARGK